MAESGFVTSKLKIVVNGETNMLRVFCPPEPESLIQLGKIVAQASRDEVFQKTIKEGDDAIAILDDGKVVGFTLRRDSSFSESPQT